MISNGPKPRLGLLFTSQDRYPLSRMALTTAIAGIDPDRFDVTVLWLDGSVRPEAVDFFAHFSSERVRLIRESGFRNLGPGRTIQLGMNRLQELGDFDWIGMFESDCYFLPDWLGELMSAAAAATADGVNVGGLSGLALPWNAGSKDYALVEVAGASNILFLPEAWQLVPAASIAHPFPKKYFADLCTLPMTHPSPELGWDWIFAMALCHGGGFEVIAAPQGGVFNCGIPDSVETRLATMIPQVYPDGRYPGQPRRIGEWNAAVRMCHALSDMAIFQCADLHEFSYLSLDFLSSWYGKETNAERWLRWASGATDILVRNSAAGCIAAGLEFRGWSVDGRQLVRVKWNDDAIGEFSHEIPFSRPVEIRPGTNVLRFEPSLPGQAHPLDSRRLAFAVVSDLGWAKPSC